MKKCNDCGKILDIDKFSKNLSKCDKLSPFCIFCNSLKCKAYSRSKNGVVSKIYRQQKSSSKKRNHAPPLYKMKELRSWIFDDGDNELIFMEIYNNWVKSGFEKNMTPSIDRINDSNGYSLENIQIVTWEYNNMKANIDTRNNILYNSGLLNGGHCAVNQINTNGKIINSFISQSEAQRITGVSQKHISLVCNKKRKTAGGFKWEKQ